MADRQAILFTDIEGSVRMWGGDDGLAQDVIEQHNRILGECADEFGATDSKFLGDGFLFVLPAASSAIACGVELQCRIAQAPWPRPDRVPRIRAVVHVGPVVKLGDEVVGPTLNLASRMLAAAHGGQTLVSEAAVEALDGTDAGVELFDVGPRQLRDIPEAVRLYAAYPAGTPRPDFVPLRALDTLPTNLSADLDRFVGREREIEELCERISDPSVRLLTIRGFGGVGKTRLLNRVGSAMLDDFADGVWFVDLASVTDPSAVPTAIASTVRMPLGAGSEPPVEALGKFLRPRSMLLLIDNYEHLLAAASVPYELLRRAPGLKCVVTSRERLRVVGENLYDLKPLSVPDEAVPLAEQAEAESVRLFVARAAEATGGETLRGRELRAATEVCRRLAGVPLAIELAAAALSQMSASELNRSLAEHPELLESDRHGYPDRHRSVRAAIEWSIGMLSDAEAKTLAMLTVFRSGFFADAARAVCDDSGAGRALVALREKSLVRGERWDEQTRYSLIPLIAEYAAARLGEEEDGCRERAARHYAEVARELSISRVADHRVARVELENTRQTLAWAEAHDEWAIITDVMRAVWPVFNHVGASAECLRWQKTAVAASRKRGEPAESLARLLVALAVSLKLAERSAEAATRLDEASRLCELDAGGDCGRWVRLERAALQQAVGDHESALATLAELVGLYYEENDTRWAAECLRQLSRSEVALGRVDDAAAHLDEALGLERAPDEAWGASNTLAEIGQLRLSTGDNEGAHQALAESVELGRMVGDEPGLVRRLACLGEARRLMGDTDGARGAYEEALARARRYAPERVPDVLAGLRACEAR